MAAAAITAVKTSRFMLTPLLNGLRLRGESGRNGTRASARYRARRITFFRSDAGGVRRVRELAEQTGDHEGRLLPDVHGVVADALERARDEQHGHRPLARIEVVADLDGQAEGLALQPVDRL